MSYPQELWTSLPHGIRMARRCRAPFSARGAADSLSGVDDDPRPQSGRLETWIFWREIHGISIALVGDKWIFSMGYNCVFMNIDGGFSGMLVGTEMGTQWDWSTHQVTGKSAAEFAIFFGIFLRQKTLKSKDISWAQRFERLCSKVLGRYCCRRQRDRSAFKRWNCGQWNGVRDLVVEDSYFFATFPAVDSPKFRPRSMNPMG